MKNIAIVGLSSFGFYLCRKLSAMNYNIMAIDIKEELVNQVKPYVRKAVIGDAKDKAFLQKLGITDFETVIVSVGNKIDSSILITLYLKELKIKEIIAKAVNEDHAKILDRVGATKIVFPERDIAIRMAHTIDNPNFLEYIPVDEDISLIEIGVPSKWVGKTLSELKLRSKYGIQIVIIKELIPPRVTVPTGDFILKDSDILTVIGTNIQIKEIQHKLD